VGTPAAPRSRFTNANRGSARGGLYTPDVRCLFDPAPLRGRHFAASAAPWLRRSWRKLASGSRPG